MCSGIGTFREFAAESQGNDGLSNDDAVIAEPAPAPLQPMRGEAFECVYCENPPPCSTWNELVAHYSANHKKERHMDKKAAADERKKRKSAPKPGDVDKRRRASSPRTPEKTLRALGVMETACLKAMQNHIGAAEQHAGMGIVPMVAAMTNTNWTAPYPDAPTGTRWYPFQANSMRHLLPDGDGDAT